MLLAGVLAINLVYPLRLWYLSDLIFDQVLRKTFSRRDTMIVLSALVTLLFVMRDILQTDLIALGAFRPMAWISAIRRVFCIGHCVGDDRRDRHGGSALGTDRGRNRESGRNHHGPVRGRCGDRLAAADAARDP